MKRFWIVHVVIFAVVCGASASLWSMSVKPAETSAEAMAEMLGALNRKAMVYQIVSLLILGLYAGVIVVMYLLPWVVGIFTDEVLGSSERIEQDEMSKARSLAQTGEYHDAIRAFYDIAEKQPENRQPWVEIYKIWLEKLHEPEAAYASLQSGLESHPWAEDDVAFFLFRMTEIARDALQDGERARLCLEKVLEVLPETRHSANARHQLEKLALG